MGADEIFNIASARPAPLPMRSTELDPVVSCLLGNSLASTQLRAQVRRVAPYFRSLSLLGEPGCGEEAVARSLHQMCPLHEMDFLMLDAVEAEKHFSAEVDPAHRRAGVLYLPEAEKLSRQAQEGLLRMLRHQAGQSTRVIAFAGRGLKPYISAGFFLPELAGCLGSLRMIVPTLRERSADIPMLIHCRLQQYRLAQAAHGIRVRPLHLPDNFMEAASRFHWPGNLPQLHETMVWLMENRAGRSLDAADFNAAVAAGGQVQEYAQAAPRLVKLDLVVQEHIRAVLLACNGNKLKAAEVLGISRSTLYRMLDSGQSAELLMAG